MWIPLRRIAVRRVRVRVRVRRRDDCKFGRKRQKQHNKYQVTEDALTSRTSVRRMQR